MNAVAGHSSNLLHVWDSSNQVKWLVDSGSLLSIIPPSEEARARGPDGLVLRAANGSEILCYGKASLTITIGNQKFRYDVVVADIKHHILGADFLSHFYLAPNLRDGNLLDLKKLSTLPATLATGFISNPVNLINDDADPFYKLLDKYPALSQPAFRIKEPKHGVKHSIDTTGRPVFSRSRPLPPDRLAIAKEEIGKLVKLGVCRRSKSAWSSPLIVAPKPGGGWRVCGDYRRLNNMTEMDRYPVRTLRDFTAELHGKTIFSKVDLLKGFHQIPMREEDICKTGVITPFGLFEFTRCPFGLKNAPQDFQRLMDEILGDIPHVFVYLDDILIASSSPEEHMKDLDRVFKILDDAGLTINRAKCVLAKPSLDFLGYRVTSTGITPLPERVEAISQVPPPTTVKELQAFLGMVNYYRRFIEHAADHLYHLFDCLKGRPKKLTWTADCQLSFDSIKKALASATLLHHPIPGAQLALTTDASKLAMGGVLEQRGSDGWQPLGFWSAKLQPNQQLWPAYDRELLAAFRGIRHFRPMVEGKPFTLYSDHLPLVPSMAKKADAQTARQTYQLSVISEFTTDLRYIEGKSNVVADALSRPPVDTPPEDVNCISTSSSTPTPQLPHPRTYASVLKEGASRDTSTSPRSTGSRSTASSTSASRPSTSPSTPPSGKPSASTSSTPSSSTPASPAASTLETSATLTQGSASSSSIESTTASSTLSSPDPSAAAGSDSMTSSTTSSPPAIDSSAPSSTVDEQFGAFINAIESQSLDMKQLAQEQLLDPDCQRLQQDAQSSLRLKKVDLDGTSLLVDVSTNTPRPLVPFSWRRKVFDLIHGLGHPGVERTRQAVTARFVWPSARADTSKWARECLACQRSKVTRHVVPPIGEFLVPQKRFEHVNLDLVTLPLSNGYKYLLTIVDRLSRWPQAIPLQDMTAESVAEAFAHGWVASFGVPATITTDRGGQFGTAIWSQLMATWGIKNVTTTAYHPEANGLVERFHRRLKEALLALGNDAGPQWFWRLPLVLLAIRTTVKPDVGATPADLVYGEGIAVPGTLFSSRPTSDEALQEASNGLLSNLRMEVERLQPTPTSTHRIQHVQIPTNLRTTTHVFVKRGGISSSLSTPYLGPFRVVERLPTFFKVSIPGRGVESVALARLKPAWVAPLDEEDPNPPAPVAPPSPPPPGRRPGVRTRHPAPTDRATRQSRNRQLQSTSREQSSSPAARQQQPPSREASPPPPASPAPSLPVLDDPDFQPIPSTSRESTQPQPASQQPPRRFSSDPSQRRFSKKGSRVNYSAPLRAILSQHLDSRNAS